jgi:hypothetical protein
VPRDAYKKVVAVGGINYEPFDPKLPGPGSYYVQDKSLISRYSKQVYSFAKRKREECKSSTLS